MSLSHVVSLVWCFAARRKLHTTASDGARCVALCRRLCITSSPPFSTNRVDVKRTTGECNYFFIYVRFFLTGFICHKFLFFNCLRNVAISCHKRAHVADCDVGNRGSIPSFDSAVAGQFKRCKNPMLYSRRSIGGVCFGKSQYHICKRRVRATAD